MIFLSNKKSIYRKSVQSKFCSVRFFLFSLLFISLFNFSCTISKENRSSTTKQKASTTIYNSDSLSITINATNLSEDMSSLSSNDDELALFLYSYKDSLISELPIFSHYFVLNKTNMSDTLHFKKVVKNKYILFLIEIDTEKRIELIEMQIRKNYTALIKAYQEKNYTVIERYLQDDDILGVKVLENLKDETTIEISDIHRMDRYHYQIILK